MEVPTHDQLIEPTLIALHELGGSASINEILDRVITDLTLPPQVVERSHGRGNRTELEYRLAWARTYLKKYGLIDNSERGIWALTSQGARQTHVNAREVVQSVQRDLRRPASPTAQPVVDTEEAPTGDPDEETAGWREELLDILLTMDPAGFERLCQRLLRESGFIEVEVTGRPGDGGIDGHGTIRIAGLISFNVVFQAKRHRGSIGANVVRDFRGAMVGRADKGLIISTGAFTREARREAIRDGAPPIDLIDGDLLVEKLKELKLGVRTKQIEAVEVEREWLDNI